MCQVEGGLPLRRLGHYSSQRWQSLKQSASQEVIRAAGAIGDDRLQKKSQGCA
jgi:predicted metalloprotease